MISTDKTTIQILVKLCAAKGIRHIVISPGSRNAPLSIAFNRHPDTQCYVIVDERSAAFFALGMAQQTGQTVALVCTSGTAPLNYAPAVAEAFYQRLPLLVLTADRPEEWIDQDDSQAIHQQNIFANYIKKSYQLPVGVQHEENGWFTNRIVNEAINLTQLGRKGPVHINIPLREPLYHTTDLSIGEQRIIESIEPEMHLSESKLHELQRRLPAQPKILILAGFLSAEQGKAVSTVLSELAIPAVVLAEPISNIKGKNVISTIDRVLNTILPEEVPDFQPDLVISFGGALVSKQIKTFIKNHPPKEHWYLGKGEPAIDTFKQLTAHIPVIPAEFLNDFFQKTAYSDTYQRLWLSKEIISAERHTAFMDKVEWSDLAAFKQISQFLPAATNLQLGNSSAVRYAHLFPLDKMNTVQANRGTSGIDGSTSTAVGAAYLYNGLTTFISGDISFFYDSNALWNKYLSNNLRIIVMKNGGGSLFRFIPGPSQVEELDEFFEAAQELDIEKMAALYQLPYYKASNAKELENILPVFYAQSEKTVILSIETPRIINDEVLRNYFKAIKSKI